MNKRQRKKQITVAAEKKREFEKYVSQWRRDRRLRPHIERLENAMFYGDGCGAPPGLAGRDELETLEDIGWDPLKYDWDTKGATDEKP